jgi:hypothetical protein
LPITDPRFLAVTVEEMMTDYFAHIYFDDPKAADEIEDDEFDVDSVASMIQSKKAPLDDFENLE